MRQKPRYLQRLIWRKCARTVVVGVVFTTHQLA